MIHVDVSCYVVALVIITTAKEEECKSSNRKLTHEAFVHVQSETRGHKLFQLKNVVQLHHITNGT